MVVNFGVYLLFREFVYDVVIVDGVVVGKFEKYEIVIRFEELVDVC